MVKLFKKITGLMLTVALCPKMLYGIPSAKDWYLSLRQEGFHHQINPHRVLFVTWSDSSSNYQVMPINAEKFNGFGYLDLITDRELKYFERLNQSAKKSKKITRDEFIERSFQTTLADTIVLEIAGDERWMIFHLDRNGKPRRGFLGRGTDRSDTAGVYQWFLDKVGYSGIILRRQGNFFLVAYFDQATRRTQALAWKDSVDKIIVRLGEQQVSAILQHLDSFENVGVYEVLLLKDASQIDAGTKLVTPSAAR